MSFHIVKITEKSKGEMIMNKRDLSVRMEFVTLEDISGSQEEFNYVLFNFNKPLEERLQEFQKFMKKKYTHKFTERELQWIGECSNPTRAGEFIHRVRSIIHNTAEI